MFLGAYHWDGNPAELLEARERFNKMIPPDSVLLNICVVTDKGITVYDACPDREAFERNSQSELFLGALKSLGLDPPRVEPLGEVLAAYLKPNAKA